MAAGAINSVVAEVSKENTRVLNQMDLLSTSVEVGDVACGHALGAYQLLLHVAALVTSIAYALIQGLELLFINLGRILFTLPFSYLINRVAEWDNSLKEMSKERASFDPVVRCGKLALTLPVAALAFLLPRVDILCQSNIGLITLDSDGTAKKEKEEKTARDAALIEQKAKGTDLKDAVELGDGKQDDIDVAAIQIQMKALEQDIAQKNKDIQLKQDAFVQLTADLEKAKLKHAEEIKQHAEESKQKEEQHAQALATLTAGGDTAKQAAITQLHTDIKASQESLREAGEKITKAQEALVQAGVDLQKEKDAVTQLRKELDDKTQLLQETEKAKVEAEAAKKTAEEQRTAEAAARALAEQAQKELEGKLAAANEQYRKAKEEFTKEEGAKNVIAETQLQLLKNLRPLHHHAVESLPSITLPEGRTLTDLTDLEIAQLATTVKIRPAKPPEPKSSVDTTEPPATTSHAPAPMPTPAPAPIPVQVPTFTPPLDLPPATTGKKPLPPIPLPQPSPTPSEASSNASGSSATVISVTATTISTTVSTSSPTSPTGASTSASSSSSVASSGTASSSGTSASSSSTAVEETPIEKPKGSPKKERKKSQKTLKREAAEKAKAEARAGGTGAGESAKTEDVNGSPKKKGVIDRILGRGEKPKKDS